MNAIEAAYRKLLYKLFDIPIHTKYESVLLELELKKAKDIIETQKVTYINRVWNEGLNPMGRLLLQQEEIRKGNTKSIIDEIKEICISRGLEDIFCRYADNETLKFEFKRNSIENIWVESFMSPISIVNVLMKEGKRFYHNMPRAQGRAVLLWRVGALRFRSAWKDYYDKKKMSTLCPNRLCDQEDSMNHAMICPFADVKINREIQFEDKRMADFLVRLNRDRRWHHQMPIL